MKQPQGLAIKTLHKKTVVSLLAASIIVTQQGFEPSHQTMSIQKERETMKSWLFVVKRVRN